MKDKHFLIKDFTNPFVINLVITQGHHIMVFKTSGSKHGIQIKWFKTWYSNQVVHIMVFKSSGSFHGIQNKGFNSWN